ncbi:MAG: FAD-dependent oxidoreductase [Christensenellaceae bacterium]|jgi:glycerol-3-phosphate dehydrogenase|nr:FAD-dependent oxidoreductase [Christensenellaceae bacterium]
MNFINKIEKKIHESVSPLIKVSLENKCVLLEGELPSWDAIVTAGTLAVDKKHSLGVINNIKLTGFEDVIRKPAVEDSSLDGTTPDILIIGGGVVGCCIARELSKYSYNTILVEKGYDVALAASSHNDGDVHVGIDLHNGTQKHHYNGRGNALYDDLCKELEVSLQRTGHTIVFYKNWEAKIIYPLLKLQSKLLGIKGVRFSPPEEFKTLETGAPSWSKGAAFMPSGAEVSPYKLTVALAENAAANGVKISLNTIVSGMTTENGAITAVQTNRGTIRPKLVINAAGVFADKIADMAGDRTFTIHARKGTSLILDKKCQAYAVTSMTKSPFSKYDGEEKRVEDAKKHTKGGGIIHTVDNNVLIGPSATETPYREDTTTSKEELDEIYNKLKKISEKMTYGDVITYFSGVRAPTYEEDFVVRKGLFCKNIIETAGIQSPGLTAAPAIAQDAAAWSIEILGNAKKNEAYNPNRKHTPHLADLSVAERDEYIKKNPDYGEIVCRCEEISKGEILDALNSPLPVYTVDAIKRRVRPGMGRCQGGFCSPLIVKMLAEKAGTPLEGIVKAETESTILYGATKIGEEVGNGK